ncbi:hypothetical protein FRB90_011242 [Tulasnella sp. 427]|nr:hypothetical protein FRB90_011242 [Tulasnella sp. 427]
MSHHHRMSQPLKGDTSLYVWIIVFNRQPIQGEFTKCLRRLDRESYNGICSLKDKGDLWRKLISRLLPVILMKGCDIPSSGFIKTTKAGKPYINTPIGDEHFGHSIAHDGSLLAMAFSRGHKNKVRWIGVDVVKVALPKNTTFNKYINSSNKLSENEQDYLKTSQMSEVQALNRLFVILTVKNSYIKALDIPLDFDLSRVDCHIQRHGNSEIYVDGKRLAGWEFRLFKSHVRMSPSDNNVFHEDGSQAGPSQYEDYQCCMTIYRGRLLDNCIFNWSEQPDDLDESVKFFRLGEMVETAKNIKSIRDEGSS